MFNINIKYLYNAIFQLLNNIFVDFVEQISTLKSDYFRYFIWNNGLHVFQL